MVQEKPEVQVLFRDDGRQVVALSTYCGYYLGKTSDLVMTTAVIGNDLVVLHAFTSADVLSNELASLTAARVAQIELSYQDMDHLIACYQSYRQKQQEQPASSPTDVDPFVMGDEL